MSFEFSIEPDEAFKKVKEGNHRFVNGQLKFGSGTDLARRNKLTGGQKPFVTILSCSDSRVPVEYIFDAGFGDLFVCRNAGNIIDEVTLGSIEYAAAHTGCPLLVVLGHESCGACNTTIAHYKEPGHHETNNVDDIVRRILPAVIGTKAEAEEGLFADAVIRTNVKNVCRHVIQRSPLLKDFVRKGAYRIVGAYYHISSGKVDFLFQT